MTDSLSIGEARKLVLLSQRIPPTRLAGPAIDATQSAIDHLGYIQIDTISVIQRAHDHTLWNRNPRYRLSHLEQLIEDKKVFEYWSHAAAYLPMSEFRYTLPRKNAIASGEQAHWYERDKRLEQFAIDRIAAEGPLMVRDFARVEKKSGMWNTNPAKRVLENLFMQGDLMSRGRLKFQKIYDLTERVLPEGIDTTVPTSQEYCRHLIRRFLQANGLGRPSEIAYLRKGMKSKISRVVQGMVSNGEILSIRVGCEDYFALPASLELLSNPLARSKLKILSPFDNLVIQRERIKALFNFDYVIECYLPAGKRRYGFFALPVLWNGKLVARMDVKAERKQNLLHINYLALEPQVKDHDSFLEALCKELVAFLRFNQCDHLQLHRTSPASVEKTLQSLISQMGLNRES
ncbi:MAG: crosslink repair DNA glycosylase YcaQ family protein [Verrucomicrobiota bacterium]